MSERRERLGRVLAETTLGAHVLFTAGENVTGARLREAYNEAAEVVAAAVDAEYDLLLAAVTRMVDDTNKHTEVFLEWPYHWEDVVRELDALRAAREES